MQKLIAKYGLAAHLAILAVAPLLLFPFCAAASVATVLLWLSLSAGLWMLFEPSLREGEQPHNARYRVARKLVRDPLTWILLAVALIAGFRALNTGIAFAYDAEAAVWHVSSANVSIFPGVVGSAGALEFSASVAFLVLVQSCRHSMGRSARTVFLLMSSSLAGLAALLDLWAVFKGHADVRSLLSFGEMRTCSFIGFSFGLYLLGGIAALVGVYEHLWKIAFFLAFLGIAGTCAGLFAFAPSYLALGLFALAFLLLLYSAFYAYWKTRSTVGFKLLVFAGISLTFGGLMVAFLLPAGVLGARLEELGAIQLFPMNYWAFRRLLSDVAFESWVSHLWIGTGLGSFALDFRFAATPEDWLLLPKGVEALANGWWLLLAEQGVVGFVLLVLPFALLLVSYVYRLVAGFAGLSLPHPVLVVLPLAFVLFIAGGFFDCSPFRIEALMATGSLAAVSAASISRMRRGENG